MQIGCGVYVHVVHGRPYLYVWHYETAGGRRRQVKEYVGSAESKEVREEAIRRVDAYFRRAARDLERLRNETLASVARGK